MHRRLAMKRKQVVYIIIIVVICLLGVTGKYLMTDNEIKETYTINEKENGEDVSWEFKLSDLSEDDYNKYLELAADGVKFVDRIKIVSPEKYKQLEENPFLMEACEENFQDDLTSDHLENK